MGILWLCDVCLPEQLFCVVLFQHQHVDETLWEALRVVGLDTVVEGLPGKANVNTISVDDCLKENSSHPAFSGQSDVRGVRRWDSLASPFHLLSALQLRYLALGRLVLESPKLRVLLIDEPPADELWVEASSKQVGISGVGSAADSGKAPPRSGISTADILAGHFKDCCVIIVAHHLASLRGCDRVWVLADGRKVGECVPSDIDTEQKFNGFIAACTQEPH